MGSDDPPTDVEFGESAELHRKKLSNALDDQHEMSILRTRSMLKAPESFANYSKVMYHGIGYIVAKAT